MVDPVALDISVIDGWRPLPRLSFRDLYLRAPDFAGLYRIAVAQDALFTVDQGRDCGFSRALLSHHARAGRFRRLRRGIYRWPTPDQVPMGWNGIDPHPRERLRLEWMAAGPAHAVVTGSAALRLHGLLDEWDGIVHLTVLRSRRGTIPPREAQGKRGVRFHVIPEPMPLEDLTRQDGIVLTAVEPSIIDAAKGWTSPRTIAEAVRRAYADGRVEPLELLRRARRRGVRIRRVIEAALLAAGAPIRPPSRFL